ncbi:AAA family ATPase [Endozoicomonas sp. SM1973]|uniref:AAA family ATPase n=1 Tax=Spartinivicinus marinus TaxID=2994442 RepID=A0A853I705_9GAMM|nr:AAA family ATPase [Spartinivicinus marinus]MCX4027755.1 AAA family ATPase [Spartinivicinus marinus]NYZ68559.1 AAA family ATPase [Spartinivicinus marinus]
MMNKNRVKTNGKVISQVKYWLEGLTHNAKPSFAECLSVLGAHFPLLKEFQQTQQEPQWHAEGDVAIHTDMVLTALYRLLDNEAVHITGWRRASLILGALLHDVAKPVTTVQRQVRGHLRWVSPKHETIGRDYLLFRLLPFELPKTVWLTVLHLVGEHQVPKWLVIKDKPIADYLQLARKVDLELIYFLALADMQGRECEDKQWQLELLELFKMQSRQYNLWQQPPHQDWLKVIEQDISCLPKVTQALIKSEAVYLREQGVIHDPADALGKTYHYRNKATPQVIVACGLSGSGKSTWIERHHADLPVISLDSIRQELTGNQADQRQNKQVVTIAKQRLKDCLRNRQSVVWDATNIRRDFRDQLFTMIRNYDGFMQLVMMVNPMDICIKQNQKRANGLSDQIIVEQQNRFEFPLPVEAHQLTFISHLKG